MGNRLLLWLGAGAVCAGVTVGMLAGAGSAFAQTESGGDASAATSPSTTKSADSKPDSGGVEAKPKRDRPVAKAIRAVTDAVDDAMSSVVKAADGGGRDVGSQSPAPGRPEPRLRSTAFVNNVVAAVTELPGRKVVVRKTRQREDVAEQTSTVLQTVQPLVQRQIAAVAPQQRQIAAVAPQRQIDDVAPQRQIDVPPVISALGTAVFNLISFGEGLIEGPPKALPGSGVTVKRSTLQIGAQEVPADWYFPAGYNPDPAAPPPERIIYLQHGFLARGVFYDYTASYLARSTNSVVVAPTLTSNIFATDGMWLGGDQMHRAAADLFNDDNTALLESAQAAGYRQSRLPQNVVLIGHSLGGGFVIDTARYLRRNQQAEESTYYHLAGVVMLDGVSFTDPVPILADDALDGVPVYNLSATPYPWNLFGTMDAALAQVRPTEFHGAQLLFGFHSDAMVGGNPLIQLGAYLLTGYGGPANVAGSQVLAAGWIDDLFDGDRASGFYGEPGGTIKIPTPVGPALGLVQPNQGLVNAVLQDVTGAFFGLLAHINFATDLEPVPTQSPIDSVDPALLGPSPAGSASTLLAA